MSHFAVEIPTLETERLFLRAPSPADAEAYVAFFASDRARFVGGNGTRERAWQAFAMEIGHWVLRGFGSWAVIERGSDESLGYVGCWYPEPWPEKEIGWLLWAGAEGRGIGFEAASAVRAYAYGTLGWPTAVSYINHGNARSIALAERLGAVRDPEAARPPPDEGEAPCLVYRHPAPAECAP